MKKATFGCTMLAVATIVVCAFTPVASAQVGMEKSGTHNASASTTLRAFDLPALAGYELLMTLRTAGRGLQSQSPSDTPAPPSEPSKTDVTITKTETHWYANPVWVAIGILAAGLLIVLVALAVRGPGRESTSSTTIVHD